MNHEIKVTILHKDSQVKQFSLSEDVFLTIGRDAQCDVTIQDPGISRSQATLMVKGGEVFIADDDSTNKTWIDNTPLEPHQFYPIITETTVLLGQTGYALKVQPIYVNAVGNNQNNGFSESQILRMLDAKGKITIGRDPSSDLRLDSLQVSRQHAVLEKRGDDYFLQDLNSKNGTYINGQKISTDSIKINEVDRITIGIYDFFLRSKNFKDLVQFGYAIIANGVEKKYPKGIMGLHKMSLKIPSKSFVALMGPSGCGKSTLLKGLIGANPFTKGVVHIHGLKLDGHNFNQLKRNIGYVPQDDIIHKELTVEKTLFYAAKLRMADDVTDDEMNRKIEDVLSILNINEAKIKKSKVGDLSGGQRKRISIAVELLNDPTILFLDEPTSPLDPETIGDFLNCIRKLTERGVTVIMVTHKPSDLEYVDKVIFLSAGGHLTYYGNEAEFLPHFEKQNIIDVYAMLKNVEVGKAYGDKWLRSIPQSDFEPKPEKLERRSDSFLRQWYWLSLRYFSIKWSDWQNMALLLFQPVIIASLIGFIFEQLEVGVLFLMAVSAVWFGVSNASKEIVSENHIYERERMFNLNIGSYLLSKISILSLIALAQCLIFVGIIFLRFSWHETINLRAYTPFVITMLYLSVSATLFGLLLSSIFNNTEKVMTIVPVALIPQIMLAGVVSKINTKAMEFFSFLTLGRWGTESLSNLQDDLSQEAEKYLEVACGDETKHLLQSVLTYNPQCDTTIVTTHPLAPDRALNILAFYGDSAKMHLENPNETFMGYNMNLVAILILNVITLTIIVYFLKKRDKLKKNIKQVIK